MGEFEQIATEVAENTETTAEEKVEQVEQEVESEKSYTQAELEEIVERRLARNTAKIHKEYEKKYGPLETVLKAGTGIEDVAEITDTLREHYQGKGVEIPTEPKYSDKDIKVLATAEADEIIKGGIEDVKEELDRLTELGVPNMDAREKLVYLRLAEYQKDASQNAELAKLGVTEDVYKSQEFREFASQFKEGTSATKIYELYNSTKPKKEIKPMGSMTHETPKDDGVKDYYSFEEAQKFTKTDFDKNPKLFKAVERSMPKWK